MHLFLSSEKNAALERKKKNRISIWTFIINVMKGISWSTYLKVVFYMKRWIPPTSCSLQLTQRWCAPTRRTYVYHHCFMTLVHSYIQVTTRSIDYILFVRALGVSMWKQSWLKCFNLNIPLFLIRTNFMKEIKTLLTQTLHRKTLKLLCKKKKNFFFTCGGLQTSLCWGNYCQATLWR